MLSLTPVLYSLKLCIPARVRWCVWVRSGAFLSTCVVFCSLKLSILICLMQVQGIAIALRTSDARNEVRLSRALSFGGQDHRRSLAMSLCSLSFLRWVCKSALYYLDSDL